MRLLTVTQEMVLKALQRFITREGITDAHGTGKELGMTGAIGSVRQHLVAIERKG